MGTVQLVDAQKRFGQHEVIKHVSLGIEDGEFVVLVGPSGCGKSTLLRLIAGLEDISGGDIRIDGQSVAHVDPAERGIAMVFQSYALYPHKTVRENMGFALQIARRPKEEIAAKVEAAADTLHLRALLDRYPRQLSGGQRQRVAIGRAIVRDPAVFLFDEPLSNLDAELRVEMRLELAQLHQRLGTTMIYVTHDQTEAMTLADKIVVLRDGQVEQVGSPLSLYDDPNNTFVATFIGSPRMNMLSVAAHAGEGGAQLTLPGGGTIFVPGIKPNTETIMMGVRPERISLRADQGMPFEVSVVEHLGGTTYLYGTLADGTRLTVESDDRNVAAGDTLQVGIAPADCFVFDQEGQRLRHVVA